MKSAPLILVVPSTQTRGAEFYDYSLSLSHAYTSALIQAGGVPCVIPCEPMPTLIEEYVERCAGVMLTGGDDIQIGLYADAVPRRVERTVTQVDPKRDLLELLIIKEVFRQRKPLLAICRGHQILNVALGGTLFTDIPLQVPEALNHSREDRKDRVVHAVTVEDNSLLFSVFGKDRISVNSSHHQAVQRVAEPLRVTGKSPDGIIEAVELKVAEKGLLPYLLSVQFHPERLVQKYSEFVELFRSFTRASASAGKKWI